MDVNKNVLLPFLEKMADYIRKDKLSSEELKEIGKFYLSYTFKNNDHDEKDFFKFLTMGWYVYECLQQTNDETK